MILPTLCETEYPNLNNFLFKQLLILGLLSKDIFRILDSLINKLVLSGCCKALWPKCQVFPCPLKIYVSNMFNIKSRPRYNRNIVLIFTFSIIVILVTITRHWFWYNLNAVCDNYFYRPPNGYSYFYGGVHLSPLSQKVFFETQVSM